MIEARSPRVAASFHGDAVVNAEGEERTEEQHPAEVAVDEKMRERPSFDRNEHRMTQPSLDAPRGRAAGGQRDEGEPDERHGDMMQPVRRLPDLNEPLG